MTHTANDRSQFSFRTCVTLFAAVCCIMIAGVPVYTMYKMGSDRLTFHAIKNYEWRDAWSKPYYLLHITCETPMTHVLHPKGLTYLSLNLMNRSKLWSCDFWLEQLEHNYLNCERRTVAAYVVMTQSLTTPDICTVVSRRSLTTSDIAQ